MSKNKEKTEVPKIIQEYFLEQENEKPNNHSTELFHTEEEDIFEKTDLHYNEIIAIANLLENDNFLHKKGIRTVYNNFLNNLLRLKISKDRKSRQEYVEVNKARIEEEKKQIVNSLGGIKQ